MQRSEGGNNQRAPGEARDLEIQAIKTPHGFRLSGDLSYAGAQLLSAALAGGGAHEDVTLDLDGVTFVDTLGLNAIAGAAAELDGARIILHCSEPWLHKVLVLSGIDTFPNVELRELPR
jgi:anti-anti-sigma regulatory factor